MLVSELVKSIVSLPSLLMYTRFLEKKVSLLIEFLVEVYYTHYEIVIKSLVDSLLSLV